jgi:hypothetical protein
VGDKFTYEYNFTKHRLHDIRVEEIQEIAKPSLPIRCLGGSGMIGSTKYDEYKIQAVF